MQTHVGPVLTALVSVGSYVQLPDVQNSECTCGLSLPHIVYFSFPLPQGSLGLERRECSMYVPSGAEHSVISYFLAKSGPFC